MSSNRPLFRRVAASLAMLCFIHVGAISLVEHRDLVLSTSLLLHNAVIIAGVVASAFIQKPFGREIWKRKYRIAILQFVCYPATLLVAAIAAGNGPQPSKWGFRATYALALLSLGIGVYWVWLMKELRWYATSVVVLQVWFLVGANIIAEMALTGTWF